jgi:hypothetical protein
MLGFYYGNLVFPLPYAQNAIFGTPRFRFLGKSEPKYYDFQKKLFKIAKTHEISQLGRGVRDFLGNLVTFFPSLFRKSGFFDNF